jgi:hypothetical protein
MYLIDQTTFIVLHVMAAWFPLSCIIAAVLVLRARLGWRAMVLADRPRWRFSLHRTAGRAMTEDRRAMIDALRLLYMSGASLLELCKLARDAGFVRPLSTIEYALNGIQRRAAR